MTDIGAMRSYSSLAGPLGLAMNITKGKVLELGAGVVSTPLLHWMCGGVRPLITVEEDPEWISRLANFRTPEHQFIEAWEWPELFAIIGREWDLVLIDNEVPRRDHHGYTLRLELLRLLGPFSNLFVVHDTEDQSFHDTSLWEPFKYRLTFKPEGLPWTTLASMRWDFVSELNSRWSTGGSDGRHEFGLRTVAPTPQGAE